VTVPAEGHTTPAKASVVASSRPSSVAPSSQSSESACRRRLQINHPCYRLSVSHIEIGSDVCMASWMTWDDLGLRQLRCSERRPLGREARPVVHAIGLMARQYPVRISPPKRGSVIAMTIWEITHRLRTLYSGNRCYREHEYRQHHLGTWRRWTTGVE